MNPNDHPVAATDLVKVAAASDEAEAELIQGFLREEGVRSVVRRTPGFGVPEYLAAGPYDVFAAAEGADVAREVLQQANSGPELPATGAVPTSRRVQASVLIAVALVAAAVCVVIEVWV